MTQHFVGLARLRLLSRPVELAEAVELTEMEVAAVLAAVGGDEVTVTMAGAIVPLTSVLSDLVGLDLNSITMADGHELGQQFFIDLGDVLNYERLDTLLVENGQRVHARAIGINIERLDAT